MGTGFQPCIPPLSMSTHSWEEPLRTAIEGPTDASTLALPRCAQPSHPQGYGLAPPCLPVCPGGGGSPAPPPSIWGRLDHTPRCSLALALLKDRSCWDLGRLTGVSHVSGRCLPCCPLSGPCSLSTEEGTVQKIGLKPSGLEHSAVSPDPASTRALNSETPKAVPEGHSQVPSFTSTHWEDLGKVPL